MIFGECPYCGGTVMFDVPEQTPRFRKETCEGCGKEYWEYYSRMDPQAYTTEGFEREFVVDEANRTITRRA